MRVTGIDIMEGVNREELTATMVEELPALRARVGLSQEHLCEILGVTRPHLSAIETQREILTWTMFLSLLMFFSYNERTQEAVERAGLLPEELKTALNVDLRGHKPE